MSKRKFSMQFSDAEAVCRVLKLLDGYLSEEKQHVLKAWNGGVMTPAELREHAQAAIALLPNTWSTKP